MGQEKIRIAKAYTATEIEEQISSTGDKVMEILRELLILAEKSKSNNYQFTEASFEEYFTHLSNVQINIEDIQNFVRGREALTK